MAIVHLVEFRVVPGHEAEVPAYLRNAAPAERHSARLRVICIGRRLRGHSQEHIAVVGWRDGRDYARGTDPLGVPSYLSAKADLLSELRSSAFDVSTVLGDGTEGARILRVYRTHVVAASLGDWQRRSVEPLTRLSEKEGLVYLRAGTGLAGPDASGEVPILILCGWRDWDAMLAATGGHIERPAQESNLDDLEGPGEIDHYELLEPGTRTRLSGPA
jgi:hypothetical protein